MLKFNPSNYLTFTPNSQEKLESSFIISNPSNNCSAPFKIKSTKPQLFNVKPHIGVILPLQQVQVSITTLYKNTQEFAKEIAHQHKFRVQYSMLERAPSSITDAISKINDQNKQIHKLYISTPSGKGAFREDHSDAKSNLSNRLSYGTARDQNEEEGLHRIQKERQNYSDMNNEQRFDYLKTEIDKLEKQRSVAIMASKPNKKGINILTAFLILLFMVIVGNLSGKMLTYKGKQVHKPKRKPKQSGLFGFFKFWGHEQPEIEEVPWWQFWKQN